MKNLTALKAYARAQDAQDVFKHKRKEFILPKGVTYLDGNSLGAAPKAAMKRVQHAATYQWADQLVRSYNDADWWISPQIVGDKIAKLIGAGKNEVVACDTTSGNIYKMLHAALAINTSRNVILAEENSFPTDIYIAQTICEMNKGLSLKLVPRGKRVDEYLDESIAVLLVNQVDYKTGERIDMLAVTKLAQSKGVLVIWDLCHSAGAMEIDLNGANVDFAVGCGYKYLNGGPGAPAYLFAAKRHHAKLMNPLSGWWSHAKPFAFETNFEADQSMRKMLCGSQPILSMKALEAAIDVWHDVDMKQLRAKSLGLTSFFIECVESLCAGHGLTLATPREAEKRGSQVSFAHENGLAIMTNLIARGVIGDFRAPNLMRFGFAPLYVSYKDVFVATQTLSEILNTGSWKEPQYHVKKEVT